MSACCDSGINNLGCVNFCGTVETGLAAPSTGSYVIEYQNKGGYAAYTFTIGTEITFTNPFNEDEVVIFKIRKDGAYLSLNDKDCFQITTNAGVSLV